MVNDFLIKTIKHQSPFQGTSVLEKLFFWGISKRGKDRHLINSNQYSLCIGKQSLTREYKVLVQKVILQVLPEFYNLSGM